MDSDGKAVISEEEKTQEEEKAGERSQEDEEPHIEVKTREDARAILTWQQDRYQHLQSLSRGLFGTLIAMLAILVSVFVTFSDRLRPIPTEMDSAVRTAASSTPLGIVEAFLIVLLNGLILYTLLALTVYSFLVATLKLYEIFTERKLPLNIAFQSNTIHDSESVDEGFLKILRKNRNQLDETYARFTEGAFRIILFTSLVILMSIMYYYTTRLQLTNLLYQNILLLIPGSVITKFGLKIVQSGDGDSDDEQESVTFAEEFLQEDKSRWSHIELHRIENLLFATTVGISFFVVLIWTLSILL